MVIPLLTGPHILLALSTYIFGYRPTPFPKYSVVVMLDDIQLAYYDSNVNKLVYRNYKSDHEEEEQTNATFVFHRDSGSLEGRARSAREQMNITHGICVVQRMFGCVLLEDQTVGPVMSRWDAFEGQTEEEVTFSTQSNTLSVKSEGLWKDLWEQKRRDDLQMMFAQRYSPICIAALKNALHTKTKDTVNVKPLVEFFKKTLPDCRGAKVICLATGFYPRHINLTLLRDSQPVSDHQITGGELLPNGDGTYQMRKSLEVSAEELREKHKYTCTTEHILDNLTNSLGNDQVGNVMCITRDDSVDGDGTYQMRKSLEVSAEELREKHKYTCTTEHILDNLTNSLVLECTSMVEVGLMCGAVMVFICVAGAITAFIMQKKRLRKRLREARQRAQDRPSSDQSEMPLRRLES